MFGRIINKALKFGCKHALYREDGIWYHSLNKFPGVLFDKNGYVLFNEESEYLNNSNLKHSKHLHVQNGISSLREYRYYNDIQKRVVNICLVNGGNEETFRRIRQIGVIQRDQRLVDDIKKLYQNTCQICGFALQIASGVYYSEVHHIKPLGEPHKGPDIKTNMICVCPNCHVQLDFGYIKIEIPTLKSTKHQINSNFINYHNKEIYLE